MRDLLRRLGLKLRAELKFRLRFSTASVPSGDSVRTDVLITLLCSAFWLWYAWQHGYGNSPDSFYRGILAKSLVEGHPYWVNIKQGWLYEHSAWHHDATHSPLLPAIYALFFLLFGVKISVANIVASLAAGLSVFPLLRLSRSLTGWPLAGLIVYPWIVFNVPSDFLFEVFFGLSFSTTVAAISFSLYCLWQATIRRERRYIVGGAISLACYFYVRPGEQLMFFGLLVCSLGLGAFYLRRAPMRRLLAMWAAATLMVLPWLVRSVLLFGNPFFTHTTPSLWSEDPLEYWRYHELVPLPSASSYFAQHTYADFLLKILSGVKKYGAELNLATDGLLFAYALLFVGSVISLFGVRNRLKRNFLFLIVLLFAGYSLIHSLIPIMDKRYMIMPLYCVCVLATHAALIPGNRLRAFRGLTLLLATALLVIAQWNFWTRDFRPTLKLAYTNSDRQLREDRNVDALKQHLSPGDMVLGPIADVQRLSFATGLTFVEVPDNLAQLRDPPAFFRRYGIRYSLVDISRILPEEMIEKLEVVGDMPLFRLRLGPRAADDRTASTSSTDRQSAPAEGASAAGVRERLVYVDTYHGSPIPNEAWLAGLGNRITIGAGDFLVNQARIMRSGLIIIRYDIKKPEFEAQEMALLEQFMRQGGRILLLCPAWVPISYEGKSLQQIGYNRIAQRFGMLITKDATGAPFRLDTEFSESTATLAPGDKAAFSRIIGPRSALSILRDEQGHPVAMAARSGNSRLVIWGHNNMFNNAVLESAEGRRLVARILAWLWSES